jgi:hypothetical protein
LRPDVSEVVFVVDENLGESAAAGIRDAGGRCVLLTEMLGRGTPDIEWVPRVKEWGSALITRDVAMRRNPEERKALELCGVHVFIIRAHGARLDDLRGLVKASYATMLRHIRNHATPFLALVTKSGVSVQGTGGRKGGIRRQ